MRSEYTCEMLVNGEQWAAVTAPTQEQAHAEAMRYVSLYVADGHTVTLRTLELIAEETFGDDPQEDPGPNESWSEAAERERMRP